MSTADKVDPASGRIDVHHHFNAPGGRSGQADWSPERTVEGMDAAGIGIAIGWPGPVVADTVEAARARARMINEFSATVMQKYPSRFGMFASPPPLQDTEGALAEIRYSLDVLKATGIGLITQYDRAWLGNPAFAPVFEELNRRECAVFVHPQRFSGECACGCLDYKTPDMSDAWLEYPFNTARTILNLMATGTLRKYPKIRFIFCHGGGSFTPLIGRLEGFAGWFEMGPERLAQIFPEGVEAEFARLHFECAQAYSPEAMALLRSRVPDSQILFGTDFDRFDMQFSVDQLDALELPDDTRSAIEYGNARRLFDFRHRT